MGEPITVKDKSGKSVTVYGVAQAQVVQGLGEAKLPNPVPATPLLLLDDFPAAVLLNEAGLTTLDAVRNSTDDDLTAIKGIGAGTLKAIREASK